MDNHSRNGSLNFEIPTILNPPPTIFGGYNPDGTPIPPALPGPVFGDVDLGSADDNDPKRRRIARAWTPGLSMDSADWP